MHVNPAHTQTFKQPHLHMHKYIDPHTKTEILYGTHSYQHTYGRKGASDGPNDYNPYVKKQYILIEFNI